MTEILEKHTSSSRKDRYFYDDMYLEHQDYYDNIHRSGKERLLSDYKGTVYACANINAGFVASFEPKLYVKTAPDQKPTRQRTRSVPKDTEVKLKEQFKLRDEIQLEEVVEHPVLKLLERVDDDEVLVNSFQLWEMTQLYQETCGEAYWWIRDNELFGIPQSIMLLPSQYVTPEQDIHSRKFIDRYVYKYKDFEKKFQPGEVIQFLSPGLQYPYLYGLSPEEASVEAATLINKLKSMMTGVLSKEARPDMIISPKETMGSDEAKNFERRLNMKYSHGKSGGIHVSEEPVDTQILNFPPKDLAQLEIQKRSRDDICNTYGVPVALLQSEGMNRETLNAAFTQLALIAIRPRLNRNCAVLNKQLITRYDKSGRMFLASDDPVPEDVEAKLQENVQLVMNGIKTRNEARKEYNLPPHPDGDKLEAINTPGSGAEERNNSRNAGTSER